MAAHGERARWRREGELAGDVADTAGLPLTPVAVYEDHFLTTNVIKGNSKKVNYPDIPTVVFTIPSLASVGLTEKQAKQ
ncbi:hypothetical protein [Pontibacter ummariensis]|uniref:hypothetical protein n=1 Tax=Pontibacter ummariensis TaxID=1610492 RepID=UPI001FE775ED|nr:hypothetical protein [Pontibacter ummariensis]